MTEQPALKSFIPIKRPDAKIVLWAFPYGGGTSLSFYKWAKLVPADWEIRLFDYPGFGINAAETTPSDLNALVDSLTKGIHFLSSTSEEKKSKNLVFFGHSLGALVAFLTARNLEKKGLNAPTQLFLSSCAPPKRREHFIGYSKHMMSNEDLIKTFPSIFQHEALEDLNLKTSKILHELHSLRMLLQGFGTWQENISELPLKSDISIIAGTEESGLSDEMLSSWACETTSNFSLKRYSGGHFYFKSNPVILLNHMADTMSFS